MKDHRANLLQLMWLVAKRKRKWSVEETIIIRRESAIQLSRQSCAFATFSLSSSHLFCFPVVQFPSPSCYYSTVCSHFLSFRCQLTSANQKDRKAAIKSLFHPHTKSFHRAAYCRKHPLILTLQFLFPLLPFRILQFTS